MEKQKLIERLTAVKLTLLASAAVTDTIWMIPYDGSTVCEEIDHILHTLGVSEDELEEQYLNVPDPEEKR